MLNKQQEKAVTYTGPRLLVEAGAGSGKTKTLTHRVAHLIEKGGTPPSRILLLTFTRRAASEMLSRVEKLGVKDASKVWGGTFHAMAYRLIHPQQTVMDEVDSKALMDKARKQIGLTKQKGKELLEKYSWHVNACIPISRDAPEYKAFHEYHRIKKKQGLLDFDDLLLLWLKHISRFKSRFVHTLVDEYQDTSPLQARIITSLDSELTVVGDSCQSIYGFRAASIQNIEDLIKAYPDMEVIKLEQNYRSTPQILLFANAVMRPSKQVIQKELWSEREDGMKPVLYRPYTERDQDTEVVRLIREHGELQNQAVLFRAGYLSAGLEIELAKAGIPFKKYGGLKFAELAHIKDMTALIRLLHNPHDEPSWTRILRLIKGIGAKTAEKIYLQASKGSIASSKYPELGLLERLRHGEADLCKLREFYVPLLAQNYENAEVRERDLYALEDMASNYSDLSAFVSDLTLEIADQNEEHPLTLSTIHSAKGQEWNTVYIIYAVDGFLPSDLDGDVEEELRLFYVASTRAKDRLYVFCPQYGRAGFRNRDGEVRLSRFLTRDALKRMKEADHVEDRRPRYGWPWRKQAQRYRQLDM